MTHCGTVSFSSMDSVSPPESLHSNLQTQDNVDFHEAASCGLTEAMDDLYLNRVLPPASPKMTGVCGGTWK